MSEKSYNLRLTKNEVRIVRAGLLKLEGYIVPIQSATDFEIERCLKKFELNKTKKSK